MERRNIHRAIGYLCRCAWFRFWERFWQLLFAAVADFDPACWVLLHWWQHIDASTISFDSSQSVDR